MLEGNVAYALNVGAMYVEDFASRSMSPRLDGVMRLEESTITLTHNLETSLASFLLSINLIMHLVGGHQGVMMDD